MNHSYDPGSILHYGQYSLSKNKLPTMELRQGYGDIEIGQRFFMTANDVAEINNLYKCKGISSFLTLFYYLYNSYWVSDCCN